MIKCSNIAESFTTSVFYFIQTKDPSYNCLNKLESADPMQPNLAMNYSTDPTSINIPAGFAAFIRNTEPVRCPEICRILAADCSSPLYPAVVTSPSSDGISVT